jgi:hypothetical protein
VNFLFRQVGKIKKGAETRGICEVFKFQRIYSVRGLLYRASDGSNKARPGIVQEEKMTTILHKLGVAAMLVAATAIVPACTQKQADQATMDKMSKDVSDAKVAAENAARSAAQAADAAKAAQQAADQASMTNSRATGRGMRNK